jgi:hypothetical protein
MGWIQALEKKNLDSTMKNEIQVGGIPCDGKDGKLNFKYASIGLRSSLYGMFFGAS